MSKEFRQEYEQRIKSIMDNKDLSSSGKKKQLEEFESLKRNEARHNIKDLRASSVGATELYKTAKETAKAETEKAVSETDWTRLLYMSYFAKSSIEGLGLSEIKEKWESVKSGQDDYLRKAWRETLPGALRTTQYKDITKELPGLLEDITASKTEQERAISDGQKGALSIIYSNLEEARQLDLTFKNNGGIERRVTSGIHLNGDDLTTDFKAKNITSSSGVRKETAKELVERLEKEYIEKAEYIKARMDSDIDIDFDDATGGVFETEESDTEGNI